MSAISSVLSALSFILSLVAVICVARIATVQRELLDQLTRFPASRLQSIETSLSETQEALSEVANRVKMMKVRNAANHSRGSPGEPDPYSDPDAWRKAMNKKLSTVKLS